MFKNSNIKKNQGFTILEILITIILLSTIAVTIIPLFTRGIALNKNSKNKLYAYEAARSEIEKMRSSSFNSLNNHSFSVAGVSQATGTVTVDSNVNGSSQTDIIKVTALVTWPFNGRNEEIRLETYIAEKGINQ
ncbi:MAG: prepilin-type N-terminal cleavage/methylation domain-containing protein [Patescibacteria group bacterium]|nr:prepilin-type N-terminal cleavage/methylation domain-containing protein [Patescibacteria group bacterium]